MIHCLLFRSLAFGFLIRAKLSPETSPAPWTIDSALLSGDLPPGPTDGVRLSFMCISCVKKSSVAPYILYVATGFYREDGS